MPTAAKKAAAATANPTEAVSRLADVTDWMHGLLVERADALMGGTERTAKSPVARLTTYAPRYWPDLDFDFSHLSHSCNADFVNSARWGAGAQNSSQSRRVTFARSK